MNCYIWYEVLVEVRFCYMDVQLSCYHWLRDFLSSLIIFATLAKTSWSHLCDLYLASLFCSIDLCILRELLMKDNFKEVYHFFKKFLTVMLFMFPSEIFACPKVRKIFCLLIWLWAPWRPETLCFSFCSSCLPLA